MTEDRYIAFIRNYYLLIQRLQANKFLSKVNMLLFSIIFKRVKFIFYYLRSAMTFLLFFPPSLLLLLTTENIFKVFEYLNWLSTYLFILSIKSMHINCELLQSQQFVHGEGCNPPTLTKNLLRESCLNMNYRIDFSSSDDCNKTSYQWYTKSLFWVPGVRAITILTTRVTAGKIATLDINICCYSIIKI